MCFVWLSYSFYLLNKCLLLQRPMAQHSRGSTQSPPTRYSNTYRDVRNQLLLRGGHVLATGDTALLVELYERLAALGCRVWYDEACLQPGVAPPRSTEWRGRRARATDEPEHEPEHEHDAALLLLCSTAALLVAEFY